MSSEKATPPSTSSEKTHQHCLPARNKHDRTTLRTKSTETAARLDATPVSLDRRRAALVENATS